MRPTILIILSVLTLMIASNVAGDDQASQPTAKFRRQTRLGFTLFADYWDVSSNYDSENSSGSIKHSGDMQGDFSGITLFAFRAPSDSAPLFGEISIRGGELSGDIRTSGNTAPYVSEYVIERQEIEFRGGTVLYRGAVDVHGSMGGLYVGSETKRTLVSGSSLTSDFSAATYLGSFGAGLVTGSRAGQLSFGARLDAALLLGAFDPEYGDGGFVWGYDARLTAFADYEIPMKKFDLVFLLKVGGIARDIFGQDTEFSDASTLQGAFIRAGVSVVF